jgi:hypothetical protein
LPELALDGRRNAVQCEFQRSLVELPIGDFIAQAREHFADAFGHGGMSVALDQCSDIWLTKQIVG